MKEEGNNIHTVFEKLLKRADKEGLLNQHSKVIWLTGLSGSGKTSIAIWLEQKLNENGYLTQVLDGDNVRTGINNNLAFTEEDRLENIRRISEVSKLFLNCGIITINSFVSPTEDVRDLAKKIIGEDDFLEVFINTSLEECEKRDVKGLYKKARKGEIPNFTGISAPFEAPKNPALIIETEKNTIEQSGEILYRFVIDKIRY
jgi:adenylylsulfate kinase|tara:strand:+ start:187 stop:792 length:606 start_codon:yes stop_codon:yes gene_type:complete